ncbi:cytochrome c oxidase assembly protein [Aquincola agrisoli]|uniref:cytochrome c oxidase assembly protein n=1 Tax=Aquincola sp. GCM10022187 TaxID=3252634 RepID=UPI00366F29A6
MRWVPYCGEAPGPEAWLSRWNFDPVLGAFLLLAAVALLHSPAARALPPVRRRSLGGAWALTVLLYVSPLCALSSTFFTVRVVHHIALVLLVAPLLAHGMAPWLRGARVPLWTATAAATVVFWVWHAPAPYAAALSSDALYAVMQLTLLISAVAFWLGVRQSQPTAAMGAILATTVQMGLLGALIMFAARALYAPHFASMLSWGISPLEDQQLAGLLMWAPGSMAYLVAAMCIGWRWLRSERADALRTRPA